MSIVDELGRSDLLSALGRDRLEELAAMGSERRLAAGEFLFRQGDEARAFWFVLDGAFETTHRAGGNERAMMRHETGGYIGAIALLTRSTYRGSTRALVDSRLFELDAESFFRFVITEPDVLSELLGIVAPVVESVRELDASAEKLLALGSLAAGLAHELNNPAAAAQRAASDLREADERAQVALAALAERGIRAAEVAKMCGFAADAVAATASADGLDPLERADRESELVDRLAERGVSGAEDLALPLVDAGLDGAWVDDVVSSMGPSAAGEALAFIASRAVAARLARELEEATGRIAQLVHAVREYSYLDRSPRQEIDVHDGLDSTLAVLGHKRQSRNVEVVREYEPTLPRIDAYAAELNQVWTNLIDNAIGAVEPGGRVTIRTERAGDRVLVEVADDGPGIPADVRSRVFDAFFTTKSPGEGTGLGLDIARRIVARHDGEIRLAPSERGARFQVLLPLRS